MGISIDEHSEALDMILREFDDIKGIHNTCISNEYSERREVLSRLLKDQPVLTTKERAKKIAKVRPKLLKLLKYKTSHELGYATTIQGGNFHTEESVALFKDELRKVKEHPKLREVLASNKGVHRTLDILAMERRQRVDLLEADCKEYKMDFITGKRELSTFFDISNEFRKEIY